MGDVRAMLEQALSDIRVLDLTWYISGPYCTKLLADFGAEVIKVEKPGEGDPARRIGPFPHDEPHHERSALFLHLNTNKESITLNLKSRKGKKIVKELVRSVDILVESFSPRVMPSLGLSYEILRKVNPRLVMTSISNFGQNGPYRDFKASELIEYAMGGEMYSTGIEGREPLKLGGNVVQYQAGTIAAVATLGALFAARYRGVGQHVDVSIMETQAGTVDRRLQHLLAYAYGGVLTNRWPPPREAKSWLILPSGVYPCKDGFLQVLSFPQWLPRYAKALGMPEMVDDPKFKNVLNREYAGEFDAIWYSWLAERSKADAFQALREAKIAAAPVNSPADLLIDTHLAAREYFVNIEHPEAGQTIQTGAPFKMSETPWQIRRPAPLLGEHNKAIYSRLLGYTEGDLQKLRRAKVI